jgi:hypothetical protein
MLAPPATTNANIRTDRKRLFIELALSIEPRADPAEYCVKVLPKKAVPFNRSGVFEKTAGVRMLPHKNKRGRTDNHCKEQYDIERIHAFPAFYKRFD